MAKPALVSKGRHVARVWDFIPATLTCLRPPRTQPRDQTLLSSAVETKLEELKSPKQAQLNWLAKQIIAKT